MSKYLNHVYVLEVILFFLIVLGAVPRWWALVLAGLLAVYSIAAPLEDAVALFVRSVPLFIALPITSTFDSLNTWRIIAIIIFAKWFFKNRKLPFNTPLFLLLFLAILSVFVASDHIAAIKRVIYFVNLSLIGIVIYDLVRRNREYADRIIRNMVPPLLIVLGVGVIQLVMTYFVHLDRFFFFWATRIQFHQYGSAWADIVIHRGNTWFAASRGQVSLRVFSLLPDSHSFPSFVLLTLPALFSFVVGREKRLHPLAIAIPIAFLLMILTGTRGIWAGSVGAFLVALWLARKHNIMKYLSAWLLVWFLLFVVAYPIFLSPQFLQSKNDLYEKRLTSLFDWKETSNRIRLMIWDRSLHSIAHHPILGVGMGNFPVVLNQQISDTKAGSSAHNVYLHIAAEMGVLALLAALWWYWTFLKKCYKNMNPYFGALLICSVWMGLYSLVDTALFDERVFLMLVANAALVFSYV